MIGYGRDNLCEYKIENINDYEMLFENCRFAILGKVTPRREQKLNLAVKKIAENILTIKQMAICKSFYFSELIDYSKVSCYNNFVDELEIFAVNLLNMGVVEIVFANSKCMFGNHIVSLFTSKMKYKKSYMC